MLKATALSFFSCSQYEQSGPVRVMGYNSPFVARDRQFFEVQIPVREVASVAAK